MAEWWEWQNGRWKADGMVEWQNGGNGGNGGMAEWRNGGMVGMVGMTDGMVEWQKWLHTYYLRYTHTDDTDNDDDCSNDLVGEGGMGK